MPFYNQNIQIDSDSNVFGCARHPANSKGEPSDSPLLSLAVWLPPIPKQQQARHSLEGAGL